MIELLEEDIISVLNLIVGEACYTEEEYQLITRLYDSLSEEGKRIVGDLEIPVRFRNTSNRR